MTEDIERGETSIPRIPPEIWARMTVHQRWVWLAEVRLYNDRLEDERRDIERKRHGY